MLLVRREVSGAVSNAKRRHRRRHRALTKTAVLEAHGLRIEVAVRPGTPRARTRGYRRGLRQRMLGVVDAIVHSTEPFRFSLV